MVWYGVVVKLEEKFVQNGSVFGVNPKNKKIYRSSFEKNGVHYTIAFLAGNALLEMVREKALAMGGKIVRVISNSETFDKSDLIQSFQ